MIINRQEVSAKIEKLAKGNGLLELNLLPTGFLRMKQERAIECGDYRLYYGGHYYRRSILDYDASEVIPENGKLLCMLSSGKFLAERKDGSYEFSTSKKPLQEDFCMVLLLRALGRVVFLLADGSIAPEAFLVTLTDTPANARFCQAIMREVVSKQSPEAAQKLTEEKEVVEDGKAD